MHFLRALECALEACTPILTCPRNQCTESVPRSVKKVISAQIWTVYCCSLAVLDCALPSAVCATLSPHTPDSCQLHLDPPAGMPPTVLRNIAPQLWPGASTARVQHVVDALALGAVAFRLAVTEAEFWQQLGHAAHAAHTRLQCFATVPAYIRSIMV
jgi:hypothetical protein